MARARRDFADLRTRTLAAAGMVALAAGAVALGGWFMAGFAALLAAGMGWELRRMTAPSFDAVGWLAAAGGAGACLLTQAAAWRWGVVWTGVLLLPMALLLRREDAFAMRAMLAGAAYVALACAAITGLRDDALYGWEAVLWVALTVVATDVGGYFFGRFLGGPKLWPAVSPGKTWSGFLGGVLLATLTGAVFAAATTGTWAHEVGLVSAVMAAVAQGGDLGESALKRRAGVKDSSHLIPGHGGLLDRLDGLLAAGLVASLITFMRGQSVFVW